MGRLGPFEVDTIVQGDCLDVMGAMPDGCVDLVFADPPYRVGYKYGETVDTDMPMIDLARLAEMAQKVSAAVVCITPGIANVWQWPTARWILGWFKPGSTRRSCMKGFNVWEPVLVYGEPRGRIWQDAIRLPDAANHSDVDWHPCPKPLALLGWLVRELTVSGDIIFDPFMGSGTTAIAAKKLGRHYFGCDSNPDYVKMANERIAKVDGVQLPLLMTVSQEVT